MDFSVILFTRCRFYKAHLRVILLSMLTNFFRIQRHMLLFWQLLCRNATINFLMIILANFKVFSVARQWSTFDSISFRWHLFSGYTPLCLLLHIGQIVVIVDRWHFRLLTKTTFVTTFLPHMICLSVPSNDLAKLSSVRIWRPRAIKVFFCHLLTTASIKVATSGVH